MYNGTKKTVHKRLILTLAALILSLASASSHAATQLVCTVEVENVLFLPRSGQAGLKAKILDSQGNVVAAKNWYLCKTEISDALLATLPADVSDWTSEEDCNNALNILIVANAMDKNVLIVFRDAPDQNDLSTEALACQDIPSYNSVLFQHLHQVALIGG